MSLGKPCIVSNVGDVKILVNDRSQIVPVGDLEAVVRTLKMFFQNLPMIDWSAESGIASVYESVFLRIGCLKDMTQFIER